MRKIALLAMLGLATGSVVAAADPPSPSPSPNRERTYRDRETYQEGRYDRDGRRIHDRGRYDARNRWRPIVEQNAATGERQFVNVLGQGGRFDRLLVEGVRGAPVITRIGVEYENRQMQTFELNVRLKRGADEVIDLPGKKRIHRIVVYTDPGHRGAYSIYGA